MHPSQHTMRAAFEQQGCLGTSELIVYLFFTFSLFLLIFNYSWCDIGKNLTDEIMQMKMKTNRMQTCCKLTFKLLNDRLNR